MTFPRLTSVRNNCEKNIKEDNDGQRLNRKYEDILMQFIQTHCDNFCLMETNKQNDKRLLTFRNT